jgi:hypothetical protein
VHTWTTHKKVVVQPYDNDDKNYDEEYSDMMWNSTFGFAPGGSGAGSFRFGEILSTGGIPVLVVDDHQQSSSSSSWVPPLYPEEAIGTAGGNSSSTWKQCIVFVEERYLIDLPRILRRMSATEIRQRREHCWRLFQNIIGDVAVNDDNKGNVG